MTPLPPKPKYQVFRVSVDIAATSLEEAVAAIEADLDHAPFRPTVYGYVPDTLKATEVTDPRDMPWSAKELAGELE